MDKLHIIEDISIPNSSIEVTLRTCQAVVSLAPDVDSEAVAQILAKLGFQVDQSRDVLTRRLRQANPKLLAQLQLFDRALDVLWYAFEYRLGSYEIYAHEGLDLLPAPLEEQVKLEQLRSRAARAAELHARLFGDGGVEFVRRPYFEQAESMATVLRLIDEDELGEELEELVGPELLRLLRACQIHYEDLLDARFARQRGVSENLRVHGNRLRRLLHRYRNALVGWVDEDDPASVEIAWVALQPLLTLRAYMSGPKRASNEEILEMLEELDPSEAEVETETETEAIIEQD